MGAGRAALLERCFGVRSDALRRYEVLGFALDDLAFHDAVRLACAALTEPRSEIGPLALFFANAHTLTVMARSPSDRTVLSGADFLLGDGTGVRWAARLNGTRLRANLNGTDLVPAVLDAAEKRVLSCFLLGGEAGVVERAGAAIARRHAHWRVAGCHHGFLGPGDDDRVKAAIAAAAPDLLLVGMGNPLQERWIVRHGADLPVKVAIGVGALFSYLAEEVPRAPAAMRRLGLEWLFVLFTQRHKWMRYCFGAPAFLGRVVWRKLVLGRAV